MLVAWQSIADVGRLPLLSPRAGSGVERIDPLHFLAGCHKSQLNQALSVMSINLVFFLKVSIVMLTMATFCILLFVFCLSVVIVRLSVPVQVIDWKDSSPK